MRAQQTKGKAKLEAVAANTAGEGKLLRELCNHAAVKTIASKNLKWSVEDDIHRADVPDAVCVPAERVGKIADDLRGVDDYSAQ